MTAISSLNTAALQILQQAGPVSAQAEKAGEGDFLAAANGLARGIGVAAQPTQAQARISESLFGVNAVSVTEMKVDLINRVGRALGVEPDDFAVREDFVNAMEDAYRRLKLEGGPFAIRQLEQDLGLDKLGVTLDDVMESARNPDSNDRLTKALERETGKPADGKADEDALRRLWAAPDALGLYGPAGL